ncbi:MAG: tyrosine--tRNA ligase [Chloroflexi bacterium]|nr:tyrosine--tRNA ligase [Chloroflexota bacterium]
MTDKGVRTVLEEFRWRGMVHRTEDGQEVYTPGLDTLLAQEKVTAYIGFDPSADSLHVGNLLQIMNLVRIQRFGHNPIAIVGGGTGLIGDPGGKTTERPLLTREELARNVVHIREQLARYLDFNARNAARLVNNADWLDAIKLMDFLRDVGKHFTVNYMLAKDSVQGRMTGGISFTEFSYMLLQAYDYHMLHQNYGCNLQLGGSDQWGNITAGIELIRRLTGHEVHALVTPLIMTSAGVKFGKTEAGAVWLDAKKTSPFKFYQFWLNTADADVARYLKFFTLATPDVVAQLEAVTVERPERREAQRRLADDVTRMTHGETELVKARRASEVLFGGDVAGLSAQEMLEVFEDVPSISAPRQRLEGEGVALVDLLVESGLAPSRAEGRRLVQSGGVTVNSQRVTDARAAVTLADAIEGRVVVLRRGARERRLVRVEG